LLILPIVPISVYMVVTGVIGLRESEESAGGEDSDSPSSRRDRNMFEGDGFENPVGPEGSDDNSATS
jgi:hypothetical protein